MRRTLFVLLALAALLAVSRAAGLAQTGVQVGGSNAETDFPNGLVFTLDATASGGVDEVRLVYQIAPDGVRATGVAECTGGASFGCRFLLASSQRNLLIPGAEVTYFWRITSGGETQETEPQQVTYEDTRFQWQTITERNMTIWYYSGSDEGARAVLEAGLEALDRIGALLQTSVDFPVKVRYYGSARDMQAAIISDNQEGVVTLGEVVYSDTAMVAADSSPQEIARHEIAHIVIREAVRGPFNIPDWLNEGTAVYAQTRPLDGQRQAIDSAVRSGEVLSVRSLSSASSGAFSNRVLLFYGQSWSLVDFLVSEYGEEKFAQLFQAFKAGANTGDALEQVYGFNQDGLENAWREHVGLPPRDVPTPSDGAVEPEEPTAVPDVTTTADNDGPPIAIIAVVAVLTIGLAGGLLGAGILLSRRFR